MESKRVRLRDSQAIGRLSIHHQPTLHSRYASIGGITWKKK